MTSTKCMGSRLLLLYIFSSWVSLNEQLVKQVACMSQSPLLVSLGYFTHRPMLLSLGSPPAAA
jgi:hypothetical protein